MTKWTKEAIEAPHTQRELDGVPQAEDKPEFIDVWLQYHEKNDPSGKSDWSVIVAEGKVEMPEGMTYAEAIILATHMAHIGRGQLRYTPTSDNTPTAIALRKWAPAIITEVSPSIDSVSTLHPASWCYLCHEASTVVETAVRKLKV